MSCGNPHETDCTEVLAEVWLFLDNECDDSAARCCPQPPRRVLARAWPSTASSEKLKKLLAAKCGGEQAPDALRDQVRGRLREAVVIESTTVVEFRSD